MNWSEIKEKDRIMEFSTKGNYLYACLFIGFFLVGIAGAFSSNPVRFVILFSVGLSGIIGTVLFGILMYTKPIGYLGLTKRK